MSSLRKPAHARGRAIVDIAQEVALMTRLRELNKDKYEFWSSLLRDIVSAEEELAHVSYADLVEFVHQLGRPRGQS